LNRVLFRSGEKGGAGGLMNRNSGVTLSVRVIYGGEIAVIPSLSTSRLGFEIASVVRLMWTPRDDKTSCHYEPAAGRRSNLLRLGVCFDPPPSEGSRNDKHPVTASRPQADGPVSIGDNSGISAAVGSKPAGSFGQQLKQESFQVLFAPRADLYFAHDAPLVDDCEGRYTGDPVFGVEA